MVGAMVVVRHNRPGRRGLRGSYVTPPKKIQGTMCMAYLVKMSRRVTKERCVWTSHMDDVLVDAFCHQDVIGNRVDGTFTSKAYYEVVKELSVKLGMDFNKDRVKNRLKTIKAHFNECYDLFKGGLSGFSWNPKTKLWSVEPEVWKSLIEANPQAEKWRTTPIKNYDKMLDLFAKDRATGDGAGTAKERLKSWTTLIGNDLGGNIDDIDLLVSQHAVSLENCNFTQDSPDSIMSPNTLSPNTVSSNMTNPDISSENNATGKESPQNNIVRKGKRKRDSLEEDDMVKVIDKVAEAMIQGNILYGKYVNQSSRMTEKEIYEELVAIGLESYLVDDAYFYLATNPDRARLVFGCPAESRIRILEKVLIEAGIKIV